MRRIEGRRDGVPLPRITIVTPVRNGADTIAATIESVLAQDYPNLEYIIADGGSTDGTLDIVRGYGDRIARVISGPDRGMYDALNKGFRGASGQLFGYINADDLLEPAALVRVAEAFACARGAVAVCFEDVVDVNGWRFANRSQPRKVGYRDMLDGHILFQDGVFFRADAFRAVGGFDPNLKLAGDWDLFTRLRGYGRFQWASGHVSVFRIRAGQLSTDFSGYLEEQRRKADVLSKTTPGAWKERLAGPLQLGRKLGRRLRARKAELFFPFYGGLEKAPPIDAMPGPFEPATCPATGDVAGRLLFSLPDTRFGEQRLNRIYFCDATGIATTWPRLDNEALKPLYEKHYSRAEPVLIARESEVSPFLLYWGGSRWVRGLAKVPLTHSEAYSADARQNLPEPAASAVSASQPPQPAATVPRGLLVRALGKARRVSKRVLMLPGGPRFAGVREAFVRRAVPQFVDRTLDEILAATRSRFAVGDERVRFLDVGCFEGHLLDQIRTVTKWSRDGLELNDNAAAAARAKGHTIWPASAENALDVLPANRRYELIFLGQVIEHLVDPRAALIRLGMLLAPGGMLLMTTPNLDSWQVRLFGPTWAHWHAPYHRHLFTRRGMRNLVDSADLKLIGMKTASHPYWTCLSVQQNLLGLNGAVSHNTPLPRSIGLAALRLAMISKYLHDPFGRGDYLIAVTEKH
jgi:glycosyltransferase involved in cell wall biosynthesis/SAM-dependent methyltransferase